MQETLWLGTTRLIRHQRPCLCADHHTVSYTQRYHKADQSQTLWYALPFYYLDLEGFTNKPGHINK